MFIQYSRMMPKILVLERVLPMSRNEEVTPAVSFGDFLPLELLAK
jgi:hypothetical protein